MLDDVRDVPPRRFRLRFSLLFLFLFITAACILLGWYVQPERVTATALFEVSSEPQTLLRDATAPLDDKGLDLFKKTQLAKLKSSYVLTAAVRNPGIAGLPILRAKPDIVEWLAKNLKVSFPENGEVLEISLTGLKSQGNDVLQIVNAVAKAYKDEVIGAERQRRLATRDLLSRNIEDLNAEIKRDLNDYTDIASESGRIETGRGQVLQQLDTKRLDRVDEELMRLESETAGDETKAKQLEQRIAQLRERQSQLEKQLTSRAEKSVDLDFRRAKLERLQKIADEFTTKLQYLDIDASSPDRIRPLQPAVIKNDD